MAARKAGKDSATVTVEVQVRSIGDLTPDPKQVRDHTPRGLGMIEDGIKRFGTARSGVIDETGRILAGNLTTEAAAAAGIERVMIVPVDGKTLVMLQRDNLTEEQKVDLAITDNRTAELSSWNPGALRAVNEEFKIPDGRYFYEDELAAIYARPVPTFEGPDPNAIPEPPDAPVTKPGDLWILGDHRLLCGDSSSPADVDRLVDGKVIVLVNTDPPYNVKVEPRSNTAIFSGGHGMPNTGQAAAMGHHQRFDMARKKRPAKLKAGAKIRAKDRTLVNDFMTEEAFEAILLAWFGNMGRVLRPGGAFYIWGGYSNCANYPTALKASKLYFSQAVIWVKEHAVLTRKDFMGNHEWCFYGWREGAAHRWLGPTNAQDVWSIKKVNPQSMVHLIEKPVELASRALEYSSRAGEHVLDLFGGSGSTLIACEMLKRHAHLMEIDPAYCDVIVERWETLSGAKAVLERAAETPT